MDESRLKMIESRDYWNKGDVWTVQKELIAEVRRLQNELVHKDAVIKALQAQYVDHMKPLVDLREVAEEIWRQWENTAVNSTYTEGIAAIKSLRRALDACRE